MMSVLLYLFISIYFVKSSFIDTFNTGYDIRNLDQLASPIFEYSYDLNKTYSIPQKPEDPPIKIPDQLYIMDQIIYNEHSLKGIYYSYHEFIEEIVESTYFHLGIDVGVIGIGVDYRHEVGHIKEIISSNTSVATISEVHYSLFKIQMLPAYTLKFSGQFQAFLDMLPQEKKTSQDVKILQEFITKYGTHFIDSGSFGGQCHMDTTLSKTFLANKTVDWCKTQWELSFRFKMISIAGGWYTDKSKIKIDKEFLKESKITLFFKGGSLKYQSDKTLVEWRDSIVDNPELVRDISINPITDLVKDGKKKGTLQLAIEQYVKNGQVSPV